MLTLSPQDRRRLEGEEGGLMQFMAQLVVNAALAWRAEELTTISFAHIDACHFNGQAHLDFARLLEFEGARFDAIPVWTNTLPVSLLNNHSRAESDPGFVAGATEVAEIYHRLGCEPVYTCAPYQLPGGPQFGDHIVGSESNAVAYYNAVVGARTQKYGDFLDVACALMGRAPLAGLHRNEGRRGGIVFDVSNVLKERPADETFFHLLGALLGHRCGALVPVVTGLEAASIPADHLKALCAAGAATGGLAHFHIVGVTQEAADIAQATGEQANLPFHTLSSADFDATFKALSPLVGGPLSMIALGTPHFSTEEFRRLCQALKGRKIAKSVKVYVSTSRFVGAIAKEEGWLDVLADAGVEVLFDTCTYFTPAVRAATGPVMTNSAKWAFYAPGMLPIEVAFGSLEDCVESAVAGTVSRA